MKKLYNYISYCVYSFVPFYILGLGFMIVKYNVSSLIVLLMLIMLSVVALLILKFSKPTNVFLCSFKEVKKAYYFNYNYLFLALIILVIILLKNVNYQWKLFLITMLFLLCYLISYNFKSLIFYILGYKIYTIRGKIVYSKNNKNQLQEILKYKKSLQVIEISENIYLEKEEYNLTKFYCEDF